MKMLKDDFLMQILSYGSGSFSPQKSSPREPVKLWNECTITRKYMRFCHGKVKLQDQFSDAFFKAHAVGSNIETFTIKMTFITDALLQQLMKLFCDCQVTTRGFSMEDVRPYFSEEIFNQFLEQVNPQLLCWRAAMEDGAKSPSIQVPQMCRLLDVANAHVNFSKSNALEYVILRDVHTETQKTFMQGIFDNNFPNLKAALLCVDSIGQRQENLWSSKQWKAVGFKLRTIYSRQPGAHTIHEIRRNDTKWIDKDRIIQYANFVTETFISSAASSSASIRLRNFAQERPATRSLSWKGTERRRSSSEQRFSNTLQVEF